MSRKVVALYNSLITTKEIKLNRVFDTLNLNTKDSRSTKSQLSKRILSYLVTSTPETSGFTKKQKAYYSCLKNLYYLTHKEGSTFKSNDIILCEKSLKTAQKHHFLSISKKLSKFLMEFYFWNTHDSEKAINYKNIYLSILRKLTVKDLIEEIYFEFVCDDYSESTISETKINLFDKFSNITNLSKHEIPLEVFSMFSYLNVQHLYYQSRIKEIPNFLINSINYLKKSNENHFHSQVEILTFLLVDYYRSQALYQKGFEALNLSNVTSNKGANNWILSKCMKILLQISAKRYSNIEKTYLSIVKKESIFTKTTAIQNYWTLIKVNIKMLHLLNKIHLNETSINKIKIIKELNDIKFQKKDKSEISISFLIALIVYYIIKNKYHLADEHIQSLLRKSTTISLKPRDEWIIKKISLLKKARFSFSKLNQICPDSNGTSEKSFFISNRLSRHEIIPYEDLWDMILKILPEKQQVV